jgi:hypothetical protein
MSPRPAPDAAAIRAGIDRALATGRRIDALIPSVLLDSAISRAGFWYGRVVGWTWGFLWSRGRVERRQGLWIFRGMPPWAFRRGGTCVGDCYLTGDAPVTDRVLGHEAVHARQWRRYGILMPVLYLLAGADPLRNRFEIEAGLEEGGYLPRGTL